MRPGSILSFDRSAQGRVALAYAEDPLSERQVSARDGLRQAEPGALEAVRQRGIATAQMREGLRGIAAPLFDRSGRLVGTLALLNTAAAMEERPADAALQQASLRVSRQLGYEGDDATSGIPKRRVT